MLSVSDTSPLTALLQIGHADLLPKLFGRIVIPPAARSELLQKHPILPDWLEVIDPGAIPQTILAERLHLGETQGIALALKLNADFLLIDERRGRRVAQSHGLRITGVLGVLVLAKDRGLISAVLPLIQQLRAVAACRFAETIVQQLRRKLGE